MSGANMLHDYGFEVIHAYTAEEAVESAFTLEIDLILMEIDLSEG